MRGTGKSGGALCLLCEREQQDVYDAVEWVAKQPWSNGHVALYGYSYSAITSLLGAAKQPPHLDAVVVGHPPTDPYRDVIWHNGLYDQGFVGQWFAGQTAAQSIGHRRAAAGARPRAAGVRCRDAARVRSTGRSTRSARCWRSSPKIKVPVYIFTGWQDMYSRGDLRLIDALGSKNDLLAIDPSTHHGTGQSGEVGAPYGGTPQEQLAQGVALSAAPLAGEDTAWLDRWVKGVRNGIETKPRVRYFDLGDRAWRSAPSWQAVDQSLTTLHLSAARSGSTHAVAQRRLAHRRGADRARLVPGLVRLRPARWRDRCLPARTGRTASCRTRTSTRGSTSRTG